MKEYNAYKSDSNLSGNHCQANANHENFFFDAGLLFRANQNSSLICYYGTDSNNKVRNNPAGKRCDDNLKRQRVYIIHL